ncbi:glycoside hydrolase family protein [Algoriphagus halophytocola]|uniref:Glycoside hydrolase family protein n=1 Tax=Algoriphagus halophytocola TaxID=2991499 RepID=A0ABY6MKU7_9BACT|nr:glycoside hydrolase family protein [Algoriphagus sp. TR-M5]UZD24392.1 glycoside hydrolase family protein [Algoriphagus sp. TR-M5]
MKPILLPIAVFCMLLFGSSQVAAQFQVSPLPVDAKLQQAGESSLLDGPSVLNLQDYFVWGGSVVQGKDGKYHMLFALWESGPDQEAFTNSWVLESKIAYAVSDFPDRDFSFQKIILKGARYDGNEDAWDAQGVHNPHVKEFEGSYYLYYIGGRDPGEKVAPDVDKRNLVQQSQQMGVIKFDSFEDLVNGDFERSEQPILSPRTRVKSSNVVNPSPPGTEAKPDNLIVVNPSVDYNPHTKEYMLFFKGNLYDPVWKGVHGVATGPTPMGPFTTKDEFIFDIRMPDGKLASAEDPYVWFSSKYDCFFAVVKDFTGTVARSEKKVLALLQSKDGIKWETTSHPLFMKREVTLKSGETIRLDRLERPQLLLSEEGIPLYLYCAAAVDPVNQKNDGSSFNLQIPLGINPDH